MFLDFKDTKIFYTSDGTGKPLVLLHGFLESSLIWQQYLEEVSGVRQVICIDLPGHGQSGVIGNIHSMELMADVVKAVLEQLDVSKASFAGHSMGGYVALSFLEKFPKHVQALTLLNSTPEKDSEERIANRERAINLLKKNKETYISMALSNLLTPQKRRVYKREIANLKKEAINFPTEGITACLEGMKIRTDKIDLLKNFQFRKVSIIGRNDPVLDWKREVDTAKNCGCEILLTDGSHLSYIENPAEIRENLLFID